MSVTLESKSRINSLISAANTATGNADTDLTTAVGALIAGFGQGGGDSGSASGIYMAKVTPAEDVASLTVEHNLGTTDILLAACWAETLGDFVPTNASTLAKFCAKTDIPTHRGGGNFGTGYSWNTDNSYAGPSAPNTSGYEKLTATENSVTFPRCQSGTSTYFPAGVTYTVIVIAASAFSATEV